MAADGDEFLHRIIEAIPAGIWAVDAEGRTTFVSRRVSEVMGHPPEEMVGRSVAEFVHERDWPVLAESLRRMAELRRGGFDGPVENVAALVRRDGTTVTISFTSYPLFEDGEYAGSVSLDMTELREVERQLAESEERFRRLAENAADVIYRFRFGPEPGLEYVNEAVERVTGYTPEEYYADPGSPSGSSIRTTGESSRRSSRRWRRRPTRSSTACSARTAGSSGSRRTSSWSSTTRAIRSRTRASRGT